MVNTGKPSPGCYTCRARRIKCDVTKPECRKCMKRGVQCPGYRDTNALRIVDETKKCVTRFADQDGGTATIAFRTQESDSSPESLSVSSTGEKRTSAPGQVVVFESPPTTSKQSRLRQHGGGAKARQATRHQRFKSASEHAAHSLPDVDEFDEDIGFGSDTRTIDKCLNPPLGELVYTFFFNNFVQTTQLPGYGYMSFLIPLMGTAKEDSPISYAFSATSMVSFAMREKMPEMLPKAEKMYLRALEATKEAIGDPNRAKDDGTLASVALLTTFEQMRPTKPSTKTSEGWGSHLDGAINLVKIRGNEGVRSSIGNKIFLVLRSLLCSRSIIYGTPIDKTLYDLTASHPQERTAKLLAELALKAADLRGLAEQQLGSWLGPRHGTSREAVQQLMASCDSLEADYADRFHNLPIAWRPLTMHYVKPGLSPPATLAGGLLYRAGRIDAYVDMFVCYMLDWARSARIYLQNIKIRCHAWLLGPDVEYRYTPAWESARVLCEALCVDIAASIPYLFGWSRPATHAAAAAAQASISTLGRGPAATRAERPRLIAGLFSMWPCFAAASSDFAPGPQRDFMRSVLDHVADDMGIGQAKIMQMYDLRSPSMPIKMSRLRQKAGEAADVSVHLDLNHRDGAKDLGLKKESHFIVPSTAGDGIDNGVTQQETTTAEPCLDNNGEDGGEGWEAKAVGENDKCKNWAKDQWALARVEWDRSGTGIGAGQG